MFDQFIFTRAMASEDRDTPMPPASGEDYDRSDLHLLHDKLVRFFYQYTLM